MTAPAVTRLPRSAVSVQQWMGSDYVLVIDAKMPARTAALLSAIRRTTNLPIRFIFNTPHQGDHIYGNRVWLTKEPAPSSPTQE
jgi:glyoxylase-like metal-dependent hydrolase (beta-lactamase superfamily II)